MSLFSLLRSSPLVTAIYSWLHGGRLRVRGRGHRIQMRDSILRRSQVEVLGAGCRLTIGPGARLWNCSLTIRGEGAELIIGADCALRHVRLSVEDRGSRLHVGAGTSITGATLISQEGRLLQIGGDGMIAQHAELRNSDSHAIYDRHGTRINPPQDVMVGRHVWIGLNACIFKGAHIGDGAVIGAHALVTGAIPPACVAYGVPAAPRHTAIRWERGRDETGKPPGPSSPPYPTATSSAP
jgi:acetyltransferase-like isoleucine patch superfamily enzyme